MNKRNQKRVYIITAGVRLGAVGAPQLHAGECNRSLTSGVAGRGAAKNGRRKQN